MVGNFHLLRTLQIRQSSPLTKGGQCWNWCKAQHIPFMFQHSASVLLCFDILAFMSSIFTWVCLVCILQSCLATEHDLLLTVFIFQKYRTNEIIQKAVKSANVKMFIGSTTKCYELFLAHSPWLEPEPVSRKKKVVLCGGFNSSGFPYGDVQPFRNKVIECSKSLDCRRIFDAIVV